MVTRYTAAVPTLRTPKRKTNSQARGAAERMRAYRARRRAAGMRLERRWIADSPPAAATTFSDHTLLDARSLAMHCLIARKLAREPQLLRIAKRNLALWRKRSSANAKPSYLGEWSRMLKRPLPQLLTFITAMNEEATRLRQSSPFAGILTPGERKRVIEAFRA
jgi:hypothetical protein